jgi:SAM-dependent methyltransferase
MNLAKDYQGIGAEYYDLHNPGIPGDVEFYVEQAKRAGGPVVELGCGTGRILIPIAQAGVDVTGVDLSRDGITIAGRKASLLPAEVSKRITLACDDMRKLDLEGRRYRAALIPYRSFMQILTPEDQRSALERIREHLEPGGRLVLDVFEPKLEALVGEYLTAPYLRSNEFIVPGEWNRVIASTTLRADRERQVLDGYTLFEDLDEKGVVVRRTYWPRTIRWTHRFEMQHLLELSGFEVESLQGTFAGGPWVANGDQIWIARRG